MAVKLATKVELNNKNIEVDKEDDLVYDLGNLTAYDTSSFTFTTKAKDDKTKIDKKLIELSRDNVQLLMNKIFVLPYEKDLYAGALVDLPTPELLPREKPIPDIDTTKTKWEEFAEIRGIQKKKKGRMIWDEKHQQWMPRHGYVRGNDDQDTWLTEVVDQQKDPFEDPFEKKKQEKKDRIEKQKKQTLKNQEKKAEKKILESDSKMVSHSTASLGKYTPGDEPKKKINPRGEKRKFKNTEVTTHEKEGSLKIIDRMFSKEDAALNVTKAVNQNIATQQREEKREKPNKKRKLKK